MSEEGAEASTVMKGTPSSTSKMPSMLSGGRRGFSSANPASCTAGGSGVSAACERGEEMVEVSEKLEACTKSELVPKTGV